MNTFSKTCIVTALAFFLSACTPTIDSRGFNPENLKVDQVKLGMTMDQVAGILGTPSSISTFKPNAWYYISSKTSTTSFFKPKVLDQETIVVVFNDSNIVSDVKIYHGEDAKTIKPVDRKTETTGYESGVLREVFGNFGKISNRQPTRQ